MVEPPTTGSARGPAARLDPLAGHAVLLAATPGPDLAAAGYQETEYLASGTACGYRAAELPSNGRFRLHASHSAPYTTRVVVRRPEDPAAFNGTLVVEWLNVSGGQDVAPEYTYVATEILRGGYAWAGISAQWIGVHGGPAAAGRDGAEQGSSGLKDLDPDRYRTLHHPGDAYSYDIYTQISRALRHPGAPTDPTYGLAMRTVLAVGESQSAATLSTYYNGVAPLSRLFDGFLIHSRMAAAAPLGRSAEPIGVTELLNGEPTPIRSDLSTPVLMVQTETDLLGELAEAVGGCRLRSRRSRSNRRAGTNAGLPRASEPRSAALRAQSSVTPPGPMGRGAALPRHRRPGWRSTRRPTHRISSLTDTATPSAECEPPVSTRQSPCCPVSRAPACRGCVSCSAAPRCSPRRSCTTSTRR
jgi:Alpha/beta hydrolase domain